MRFCGKPSQKSSDKLAYVGADRQRSGSRIGDPWYVGIDVVVDETLRRDHRRVPERRRLAKASSQHQSQARAMSLHVILDGIVTAHAGHADEERMVLRKHALGARRAHDRSAEPLRQTPYALGGAPCTVPDPQGDRPFG